LKLKLKLVLYQQQ